MLHDHVVQRAARTSATRSAAAATSSVVAMRSAHDHQYHHPSAPCSARMFSVRADASGFITCRLGDWPRGRVRRTRKPRLANASPSSSRYSIRVLEGAAVPVSSGVILVFLVDSAWPDEHSPFRLLGPTASISGTSARVRRTNGRAGARVPGAGDPIRDILRLTGEREDGGDNDGERGVESGADPARPASARTP